MELEVRVNATDIRIQSNLAELQTFVTELKNSYVSTPITAQNVREAKQSLADFRKVRTAISGKMTSVKKELLAPFDEVNAKVKEIVSELDFIEEEMKSGIDAVVEAEKREKHAHVLEVIDLEKQSLHPEIRLLVEEYYDSKWDNKTYRDSEIIADMVMVSDKARATYNAILHNPHKAQLVGVFKEHYSYADVEAAIERFRAEDEAMERAAKAVNEQVKANFQEKRKEPKDEPVLAAQFIIFGTREQIKTAVELVRTTGCEIRRNAQVMTAEAYKASLCCR